MNRHLEGYEEVKERLPRFWDTHPNGRVITELVRWESPEFVVKASLYRDSEDDRPAATGLAHERLGGSGANKEAALENCETSAIGRALANWVFASGPRASREEMRKVQPRPQATTPCPVDDSPPFDASASIRDDQLAAISDLLGRVEDGGGAATRIMEWAEVSSLEELSASQADVAISRLQAKAAVTA